MSARPWPAELVFARDARLLRATFDDGAKFEIPFELLRIESPSAEARGHGGGPRPLILGKAHVNVVEAHPVGRYAVRIVFDDGHDTGLYAWSYLQTLDEEREKRWAEYLSALAVKGLSRS